MISTKAPKAVVLLTGPSYTRPISGSATMDWIMSRALAPASPPTAATVMIPESSTEILAPVASWIPRIVLPLGPMMSPILSGLIWIVKIRGA
jgi:hypothetical protein